MRCQNCGWMNASGLAKCEKCGTALMTGAPPPSPNLQPPLVSAPPKGKDQRDQMVSGTMIGQRPNMPAWDEKYAAAQAPPPKQASPPPPPPSRDTQLQGEPPPTQNPRQCPKCEYPNANKARSCVACGFVFAPTEGGEGKTEKFSGDRSKKTQHLDYDSTEKPSAVSRPTPHSEDTPNANEKAPAAPLPSPRKATSPNVNATVNPWSQRKHAHFRLKPLPREGEPPLGALEFEGNETVLNRNNLEPSNSTITGKAQAKLEYRDGQWFIENQSAMCTTFIQVQNNTPLKKGDIILMGDRLFEFDF